MAALRALSVAALICCCASLSVRDQQPKFSVIAFFTAKKDPAHISFVHEAEQWFPEMAAKYNFRFDTTSNWQNLNATFSRGTRWWFFGIRVRKIPRNELRFRR